MTKNNTDVHIEAFKTIATMLNNYYLLAEKHGDKENMDLALNVLAHMKERLPDECFPTWEEA